MIMGSVVLLALSIMLVGVPGFAYSQPWDTEVAPEVVERTAQASDLRLRGDLATSRRILEEIVRTHPDYFSARYQLGLTYQRLRDFDRAIANLSAAARLNDERQYGEWTIDNALGYALLEQGNYSEALKRLQMAANFNYIKKLEPADRQRIFNNIGLAYSHLGKPCEAGLYYELADTTSKVHKDIIIETALPGFWIVGQWKERRDRGSVVMRARPGSVSGTLVIHPAPGVTRYQGKLRLCASDRPGSRARLIEQDMAILVDGRNVRLKGKVIKGERWEPDTINGKWSGVVIQGRVTDGQPGHVDITLTKAH